MQKKKKRKKEKQLFWQTIFGKFPKCCKIACHFLYFIQVVYNIFVLIYDHFGIYI